MKNQKSKHTASPTPTTADHHHCLPTSGDHLHRRETPVPPAITTTAPTRFETTQREEDEPDQRTSTKELCTINLLDQDGSLIHGGATQLSLRKVLSFQLKNSHTGIPILFTRMILAHIRYLLILINILSFILSGLPYSRGETIDRKILNVGEELWKETLPLQMGSRLYLLEGVKSYTSYEVKISYPASIPSRFSLLLTRGNSSLGQNWKRKLLNTEKLIFKTDNLELSSDQDGMYVLVTVEPEGVVALPNVQERKEVIFNIVCDELLLFIPQHAWWVVILVVLCLGSAAVIPRFLPSYFLRTNRSPQSASRITSKDS